MFFKRLPAGVRIQRNFAAEATIGELFDWVESAEYVESKNDSVKIPKELKKKTPY